MRCLDPIDLIHGTVGCGQCMPCRTHRRREKTARLILESTQSDLCLFLTLTFDDHNVPDDGYGPVLCKDTLKWYLKSLRNRFKNRPGLNSFRYFVCGEYGTKTDRPHYHAAVFINGQVDPEEFRTAWPFGFVSISLLSIPRMAYVCSYTVKKMTSKDDERLDGKPPEFAFGSNRPGLGTGTAASFASYYQTKGGSKFLAEYGGIVDSFRFNGRIYPLDRTMREKIYTELGMPVKATVRQELWSPEVHIARWHLDKDRRVFPSKEELAARRNEVYAYAQKKKIKQSATINV